jgi:hypothetical protein
MKKKKHKKRGEASRRLRLVGCETRMRDQKNEEDSHDASDPIETSHGGGGIQVRQVRQVK